MFTTSSELRQKRHSALKGNKQSQMELAIQYYNGEGVMQDQQKALRFFKKATEQSDVVEALSQLNASAHDSSRLFKAASPSNANTPPETQEEAPAKTMS